MCTRRGVRHVERSGMITIILIEDSWDISRDLRVAINQEKGCTVVEHTER